MEVLSWGRSITSQCTQLRAMGWGSTMARANDWVPAGTPDQLRGTETFWPPARA